MLMLILLVPTVNGLRWDTKMPILLFILFILCEPIKRILSFFLYPFVYPFRNKLRTKEILWKEYLYRPTKGLTFFYWFLDDSIFMEQGKEYDDKAKRYPDWIWELHKDWLLSWWWSGCRNSCVNFGNYQAFKLGDFITKFRKFGNDNNFVEMKHFENGKRLYTEFFLFGRWNQFGWITRGRFEIDLFKTRTKK